MYVAARHGHLKCMALLVEKFNSSIELGDVGGFTPLIASAYRFGSQRNNLTCFLHSKKIIATSLEGALIALCIALRRGLVLVREGGNGMCAILAFNSVKY